MARSILGTVGLALTLAFAIPAALAGLDLLAQGRTLEGAALLGIAVLMVAVEEYVTTPTDIPGMVAGRVLGGAVKEPEPDADPGPDTDPESADGADTPESAPDTTGADGTVGGRESSAATRDAGDGSGDATAGGSEPLIPDAEERSSEE